MLGLLPSVIAPHASSSPFQTYISLLIQYRTHTRYCDDYGILAELTFAEFANILFAKPKAKSCISLDDIKAMVELLSETHEAGLPTLEYGLIAVKDGLITQEEYERIEKMWRTTK